MSKEEEFKQSLKSLVESKEFVFDEKDWEKAAAYISRQRAGSKAIRIGLLILAFAGLVGTAIFVVASPASGTKQTAHTITSNTATPVSKKEMAQPASQPVEKNVSPASSPVAAETEKENQSSAVHSPKAATAPSPITRAGSSKGENAGQTVQRGQMDVSFSKKEKTKNDPNVAGSSVPPAEPTVPVAQGEKPSKEPVTKTEEPVIAVPVAEPKKESNTEQNKEKEQVVTSAETVSATPNVAGENKNDVPESIKAKVPRLMLLSVEAGTSYQPGWKNEGAERDANGFNPVAGIHYMNQLDDRFTLSFGLQYQRTGHLNAYSHTSKQSRYSFGEESEVTTITPTRLHYLALPIRLYYKINDKNIVGGSYSIGYLLDVESNVETYTLKVGQQSNNKSYTTRGYTDGFGMFDSQVALFYRRHLYGDFSLHGELFFGLSDVKQNNFFGGDKAQRNSGLRVMLVYGIHSRNK